MSSVTSIDTLRGGRWADPDVGPSPPQRGVSRALTARRPRSERPYPKPLFPFLSGIRRTLAVAGRLGYWWNAICNFKALLGQPTAASNLLKASLGRCVLGRPEVEVSTQYQYSSGRHGYEVAMLAPHSESTTPVSFLSV